MTRRRVLVSAYASGPGRGSEPGIGWHTAREIAASHDVWLVTSRENAREIVAELAARPVERLHVVFFDWPSWLGWVKRSRVGFEVQHYAWQFAAYLVAKRLHRKVAFDVVHHVTIGRYWMASFMSLLPVPFVWGPVGGGESMPRPFLRELGARGASFELARECARWIGERDPFLAITARRSVLALASSDESRRRIEKLGARSVTVVSQVALSAEDLSRLARCAPPPARPVRFVSIGRLVHWKGFHLGLKAFARVERTDTEYWIVGSGPAERTLSAIARDLGVADRVRFLGNLSRDETLASLEQVHVLIHPSLHESGGMVCLEAMAAGRPVICLDLGGPSLQVTAETGFKIHAGDSEQAVVDLARAMEQLVTSSEVRLRMGEAGRERAARDFNWASRADRLNRLYASLSPAGSPEGAAPETGTG